MGDLYRRFWLPVLLTEELPAPDCAPVQLTVLCEKLVAFKDSQGRIGILEERCPHRQALLFWGRNEESGLRCVYHGWKFDVEGKCLEIPNAPEGDVFKEKIQAFAAYPAVESGGLVWVYMGPPESKPPLPDFELNQVPATHRYISKMFIGGNWLQAMEGDIDSSHVSFLHSRTDNGVAGLAQRNRVQSAIFADKTPRWDTCDTEYGVMLAAQRKGENNSSYWRVNQWIMPAFTMIAARPGTPIHFQVRVPIDDERQIYYRIIWHPDRPLTEEELYDARENGVNFPEVPKGSFIPRENASNNYLIDRAQQKAVSFTGIKSVPAQDWAVTENQGGPIVDRSFEHLVSADASIIAVRQRILKALRILQEGGEPAEPLSGALCRVRPVDIYLDNSIAVWEGAKAYLQAEAW
jgi:phenylpropionate dioxygenase-like ring-hydroxylating dioxygenase large terminal subunit